MKQTKGVLCFNEAPFQALKGEINNAQRLIFNENEPLLPQAQQGLWQLRLRCDWICVAAEGERALLALALAAQLPVERLALMGRWQTAKGKRSPLRGYAMRNLPLVVADVLLIGADGAQARALRDRRYGALAVLKADGWEQCAHLLLAPWTEAAEKNLLK